MGQYYKPVIRFYDEKDGETRSHVYSRYVAGDYTPAKLTEHSWVGNQCCMNVARVIYEETKKCRYARLAWIGDYAEELEIKDSFDENLCFDDIWSDEAEDIDFKTTDFTLDGKIILNVTKKLYLNYATYFNINPQPDKMFPLSLLTAIGNGRGGGDYYGINNEEVGTWVGDSLMIIDATDYKNIPEDYKEYKVIFKD